MVLDILSSGDRVELLELYARSVTLLDVGRPVDWANLFMPEALVRRVTPGAQPSIQQFQGREELLALGQRLILGEFDMALGEVAPPPHYRHLLSNISLLGEGTRCASGYCYLSVVSFSAFEPPRLSASGRYSDRLWKSPAGWCFQHRTFTADQGTSPALIAGVRPTKLADQVEC